MPLAARAADIGVLSDDRQEEYLSLLGASSAAARIALQQDGHTINVLSSLTPSSMGLVDVVWLPLLQPDQTYTTQERVWLYDYVRTGGRLVWIGDADVFNTGDDSFLSTLGSSKLIGNLDTGLTPDAAYTSFPVVTGPHGVVSLVATNTGYGLFAGAANIAAVFVGVNHEDPPASGVFAGFVSPDSGLDGTGRAALICDTSVFGQNLDQPGQSHRALLRNMVKWIVAAPGYTPSGTQVNPGDLSGACTVCTTVQLVFAAVSATGETTVAPIGSGRCGFTGVAQSTLPAGFVGYGFVVNTTALLPDPTALGVTVSYDEAGLAALGIDEAGLRMFYCPATGAAVDITGTLDTDANTISGTAVGPGRFLLGAIMPAPDCNGNGIPDECDIDPSDPDGNGIVSHDCNHNSIPDECEISIDSTAPGGPFYCTSDCAADCNNNGIPDECDIASGTSLDCNGNGIPDECETGLAPSIIQQPADVTACVGQPAAFTVIAEGAGPLTYHWRKNQVAIDGAIQSSYTIESAAMSDAGSYDAVVTGPCGNIVSAAATLIVFSGPTIIQAPVEQAVCPGGAGAFAVTASGMGTVTYLWQKDGVPLVEDGVIVGVTTPTLQISPVAAEHAGQYTCVLSDDCGSVTTTAVSLDVGAEPQISSQPTDQAACPGDSPSFTVVAAGTQLTYRWQRDVGSGFQDLVDGERIAGATTATLTLVNVTAEASGPYRCLIAGTCGAPVTSAVATLSVGAPITIQTEPEDRFACPGDGVGFTVVADGTNPTYQWQYNSGEGYVVLQDGNGICGSTAATLAISAISDAHAGLYRCIVSGSCGPQVATREALLTVGTFPAVLADPADQFICPGSNVSFSVVASGTNHTYQWQFDGGGGFVDLTDDAHINGATTATLALIGVTAADGGQYRCTIAGACGSPIHSAAALLTVGSPVVLETPPESRTICPGAQAAFSVTASGSGVAFRWQFNPGGSWGDLADGGNISGSTTDTLTISNTTHADEGQYRCIIYGLCGSPLTSSAAELTLSVGACDCNHNGIPDAQDIAAGTSHDCNGNGIPDECDLDPTDPDGNGLVSHDCNGNGIPDECDISAGTSLDCNQNGIPDECDLANTTSLDCNSNGIPDECDITAGTSEDCNHNGIPDECEPPYIAEAGPALIACTGSASALLGGNPVASGSTPPYTYEWSITSGPAGGTIFEPQSEHPRFMAVVDGQYEVTVTVHDSSHPPCTTSDSVQITSVSMSVDAGPSFAMCAGSTSATLTPVVSGGVAPYTYAWTIDPGSPNVSPSQFTGSGSQTENPTFTPTGPGTYTLRLTVSDSNNPACVAVDTLVVHAVQMIAAPQADFAMCAGGQSAPLHVQIVQQGTPPLAYAWSIDAGSPNLNPAQFTGSGPDSPNPTFSPLAVGAYTLRATVQDSSTPPCIQSVSFHVTVGVLSADAGQPQTTCVGGGGIRLAPTIQGGVGPLSYSWSIDPGSPSLSLNQFSEPHSFAATPRFTPSAPGDYTLRLTVMDSATPACAAFDTVLIHATAVTADAGANLTTQAFWASRPLGAVPVAGGNGPFSYAWRIISGPSLDAAQFSATDAEHPTFTPAAVGPYQLAVTVSEAGGAACAGTDTVLLDAIASTLTLPVNVEGRLFMTLQLEASYTREDIRVSGGRPGEQVTGTLRDDGAGALQAGLLPTPNLSRRLSLSSSSRPDSLLVVLVMYYDPAELIGASEGSLRIHRLNTGRQIWQAAGTAPTEAGPYPPRPDRADRGRQGVDPNNHCAWVVVDSWGEFAVGIASGEPIPDGSPASTDQPSAPGGSSGAAPANGSQAGGAALASPSACGAGSACGGGAAAPLMLAFVAGLSRRRSARRAPRRPL